MYLINRKVDGIGLSGSSKHVETQTSVSKRSPVMTYTVGSSVAYKKLPLTVFMLQVLVKISLLPPYQ